MQGFRRKKQAASNYTGATVCHFGQADKTHCGICDGLLLTHVMVCRIAERNALVVLLEMMNLVLSFLRHFFKKKQEFSTAFILFYFLFIYLFIYLFFGHCLSQLNQNLQSEPKNCFQGPKFKPPKKRIFLQRSDPLFSTFGKIRMLGSIVSRLASPTQDSMKHPEMHKKVKARKIVGGEKKILGPATDNRTDDIAE